MARFGDCGGEREPNLGRRSRNGHVGVVGCRSVAGGRGPLRGGEALGLGALDGFVNACFREETGVDRVERANGGIVFMGLDWY